MRKVYDASLEGIDKATSHVEFAAQTVVISARSGDMVAFHEAKTLEDAVRKLREAVDARMEGGHVGR